MTPSEAASIAQAVSARLGIPFTGTAAVSGSGSTAVIRADQLPAPNGFAVEVNRSWRSLEAKLVPDNFAGALLATMASSDPQMRQTYRSLAAFAIQSGVRFEVRINGTQCDISRDLPPGPWSRIEFSASKLTDAEGEQAARENESFASLFLSLLFALIPTEDRTPGDYHQSGGLPEGAKTRIEVNKYERSSANRAACLAACGTRCRGCGLDMAERYGPIAAGFIEVHHVTPVSRMGEGYLVDPLKDLVPLCPNCHAIVHRTDPPMTVEELRGALLPTPSDPTA